MKTQSLVNQIAEFQSPYVNRLSFGNRLLRLLWQVAYCILFRFSPSPMHFWRRTLLRLFGASMGEGSNVYPRARIWAPWNLIMRDYSCLANDVDCYNVAQVTVGEHAVVSQYSFLCTASHDYEHGDFELISKPISIGNRAWVSADVFVGLGVTIAEGAVVAARSTVVKDVMPWQVWGGSPAKFLKNRTIKAHSTPYQASQA